MFLSFNAYIFCFITKILWLYAFSFQFKLGVTLNRQSYFYADFMQRGDTDYLSADDAQQKAVDAINESCDIFREVRS